ncbi:hypothetical protein BGV91_gp17 [Haloarcula californiae icosahedral virus 1]|uniref:Uncharacterized protein n=1 Tax=Haloarcula californiae icosahedral virus 1 TaxID=1735722 RepID=A0A1C7A3Q8_9VIRU|nr:hypothetical protein BGV91_gp17 [Haloarcula californiae icosahedral virus 1]ALJ99680.1 hypothetical protein SS136_017 [Haloarcula californiae icosahedral virus 1]
MGDTPAVDEIRESEQGGNDGGAGDGDGGADGGDGGGGMFDGGIPTFGLTRRQLLLIGLVVVAVLAWKAKQSSSDAESGTQAGEEIEKARNPDLGDVTVTEDEDAEDVEVVLPANPDDELEKDQAIIDYFKESGHISGGDDD